MPRSFDLPTRRRFLQQMAAGFTGVAGSGLLDPFAMFAQPPGERPEQSADVTLLNPRCRVPLSFIIDDSTCLVNLAHFGIPHFAEVYPDRYLQDWRRLPREIPDSFVRKFGEWCREHGVKGKYSIVPYPACVGWIDRDMPGWTRQELADSLNLVRDFMTVDWDIHPEMISHTFAIDTKTGRPYPDRTEAYLENTGFSVGKSADELADYISYALRLLHNVGLPCEGITTPGGFGNRSREALSLGTLQAVKDVYGAEIPHYFRHLFTDDTSVAPRIENVSGLDTDDPQCVVSIIGCTGDWFGGWDGLEAGHVDQFITADGTGGRLPEVIAREEPAIMVCHWPGIYFNGEEVGFNIFKDIVARLNEHYDHLIWMKNSEIARYWTARELTAISREGGIVSLQAPFASPDFTLSTSAAGLNRAPAPLVVRGNEQVRLTQVDHRLELSTNTYVVEGNTLVVCFNLENGASVLRL